MRESQHMNDLKILELIVLRVKESKMSKNYLRTFEKLFISMVNSYYYLAAIASKGSQCHQTRSSITKL